MKSNADRHNGREYRRKQRKAKQQTDNIRKGTNYGTYGKKTHRLSGGSAPGGVHTGGGRACVGIQSGAGAGRKSEFQGHERAGLSVHLRRAVICDDKRGAVSGTLV